VAAVVLVSAGGSLAGFVSAGASPDFGVLFGAGLVGAVDFSSGSTLGSAVDGAPDVCGAGSDGGAAETSAGADKFDVTGTAAAAFSLGSTEASATWFEG
jgi:hypothetical protein